MMAHEADLQGLRQAALEIFRAALKEVDAGEALRQRVLLDGPRLTVFDTTYNLETDRLPIYAVALGKAALSMAAPLDEVLRHRLTGGVMAAPPGGTKASLSARWKVFDGGHPLPNQESLSAARAAMALVERAERERALLIFLISGGGSAAFEWPRDARITLEELREANRVLVSCGATITEVNAVRRAISAVKGGGLSRLAPHAQQLSLIVSDTNPGEESTVASGPTFAPLPDAPNPLDVISHYRLERSLPASVMSAINEAEEAEGDRFPPTHTGKHYLLLDNHSAIRSAARVAMKRGFVIETAYDIIEQPVTEGCRQLLSRLYAGKAAVGDEVFCLISGGEFACPVQGDGRGGRNAETVLRCALELDERGNDAGASMGIQHALILCAGTDGIDGNSPAAGAVADETTIRRASALGLDARHTLRQSDAYTLFDALGDAILTGPTGTNVRDLRILLAV